MKIPRHVTINGRKINIKQKKGIDGGSFSWWGHEIVIASDVCDDLKEEILLHEVTEYMLVDLDMRYSMQRGGDNGDYLFSFNHQQFTMFIKSLHATLKGMV